MSVPPPDPVMRGPTVPNPFPDDPAKHVAKRRPECDANPTPLPGTFFNPNSGEALCVAESLTGSVSGPGSDTLPDPGLTDSLPDLSGSEHIAELTAQ